jgi:hypothetical protein
MSLAGKARCVPVTTPPVVRRFTTDQGMSHELESAATHTCVLAGVGGHLEGHEETIRIVRPSDKYVLQFTGDRWLEASTVCFEGWDITGSGQVRTDDDGDGFRFLQRSGDTGQTMCALSGVKGNFAGDRESIVIEAKSPTLQGCDIFDPLSCGVEPNQANVDFPVHWALIVKDQRISSQDLTGYASCFTQR